MVTKAFAPVAALLMSVAIIQTGSGLQGTLLPIRAQMDLFSTLDIGVLGSAYYLGFAAGCFLSPWVVRRVGHIRTFTAMAAIASAAVLLHAIYANPILWWVVRGITGFCFAVLYAVIESWLNERATNETRGTIMSVYLIIQLTVITVGQMMVTLSDPASFPLFALASVLISIAAVPVALTAAEAPAPIESVKVRIFRLIRISPVGFAGSFAHGIAGGAFWSLSPLFGDGSGMGVSGIAVFMSVTVIAGAAGQLPMGRLSDRMDRRKVLLVCCGGAAAAALGMIFFQYSTTHSMHVFTAVWGFFAFPLYAVSVAHANDFADPKEFVEVSSGLLLVYGAGAVIGPIVASVVMQTWDVRGLYVTTAFVHVSLMVFVVWRMRCRASVPVAEHIKFTEALQATATASSAFDYETHPEAAQAIEDDSDAGDDAENVPPSSGDVEDKPEK